MNQYPVAIIGAGPSGLAAAIQLKRQGIECVIFERNQPGGLLNNANLVENYPGFPKGIKGPELVALILKQARNNNVFIINRNVDSLDFDSSQFRLITSQAEYFSRFVIIASGTTPKKIPNLMIPDDCATRVHYEVFPLAETENQSIAVIGAGDAAFDYSLNLSNHNNHLTILNRGNKSGALDLLKKRVTARPSIKYRTNVTVHSISRTPDDRLRLNLLAIDEPTQIEVDHLLLAIGREPSLNFLTDDLKMELNRLQTERRLYIVGDVNAEIFRQTSIATGEAVKAAMMVQQQLKD